ncbi:MAG: lysS [Phycisphaerales bacterium]|nr:lysS [Phycisphaerales bacterium]
MWGTRKDCAGTNCQGHPGVPTPYRFRPGRRMIRNLFATDNMESSTPPEPSPDQPSPQVDASQKGASHTAKSAKPGAGRGASSDAAAAPVEKATAEKPDSLYEQERRAKAVKLRELGVEPFGLRTPGLKPLAAVRALHSADFGQDGGPEVKVAGRILFIRDMGKLWFVKLRDETGELQVALDAKRLGADPEKKYLEVRKLLDLGDQIVVEGKLGATKTGEVTVWATGLAMGSKSLLPPPAKWEGLTDVEARYRRRYVDLWSNPEVMRLAQLRIRIVDEIRAFLRGRGFLEVETPILQPIHGGAAAKPFVTHHNALDLKLYMRIAPELYLKRLLVGGFSKVFEVNRNFRNEGISPRHNPEFTMLEAYEAYGNWETMAELVESMTCHVAQTVLGTLTIEHKDAEGNVRKTINLAGDTSMPAGQRWRRATMAELVEERTGWRFDKQAFSSAPLAVRYSLYNKLIDAHLGRRNAESTAASESEQEAFVEIHETLATSKAVKFQSLTPAEQFVEVYEKLIEPTLIDPTFVTQVPSVIIPLARRNPADPFFCDVYELAINGQEISPGYTELNDPDVQREKLLDQVGDSEERQEVDEDFLTALKYGMPPAGGLGLGIDRLVMMLTGAESIRDVILFPLMRPQA